MIERVQSVKAFEMSIINWSNFVGVIIAVIPTILFYIFIVRDFEQNAEQSLSAIIGAQQHSHCRINEVVERLRHRGKTVLANRLAASAKRRISVIQFRTYLLTIEDQCSARHPRMWDRLKRTYGIS